MKKIRTSVDCNPINIPQVNIKNSYKMNSEHKLTLTQSKREKKEDGLLWKTEIETKINIYYGRRIKLVHTSKLHM